MKNLSMCCHQLLRFLSLNRCLFILPFFLCANMPSVLADTQLSTLTSEKVVNFFEQQDKLVLTFVGYSGADYEEKDRILIAARKILSEHTPSKTIVNIGATADGIGSVYKIAKDMGFATTGIVSTQAKKYQAALSPFVDRVFYIEDKTWGGFIQNTQDLSPTSNAMVHSTDIMVGIGGGEIARDEMLSAQRLGKKVIYISADMNHQIAIEKARKKKIPMPTDFKGAAYSLFDKPAKTGTHSD